MATIMYIHQCPQTHTVAHKWSEIVLPPLTRVCVCALFRVVDVVGTLFLSTRTVSR